MATTLGGYVVEFRYRVDPIDHERYLPLLAEFRQYVTDLGLSGFEVWRSDEDPWQIVELHGYDSWSHFEHVRKKDTPKEIENLYEKMDGLVAGGIKSVTSRAYTPWQVPDLD